MLWPEHGTEAEVDWDAYRRKTARPGRLLTDANKEHRDSEEVVTEPPSRRSRSQPVE